MSLVTADSVPWFVRFHTHLLSNLTDSAQDAAEEDVDLS